MADFTKAYNRTGGNEGLWSDVPGDKGGETWKGIARKIHPKWDGWAIVDFVKSQIQFPANPVKADIDKLNDLLVRNEKLELCVRKFYKAIFWDVMRGDEILMQPVAESIYDSGVNMGPGQAIKLAQRALKIKETGKMDDATLNKVNNKK